MRALMRNREFILFGLMINTLRDKNIGTVASPLGFRSTF